MGYGYNRCGIGQAGSTTEVFIALSIPATLRTKPTVYYMEGSATPTTTIPTKLQVISYSSGALFNKAITTFVASKLNASEMLIQVKSTNLTVGHIYRLYYDSATALKIIYDAEIY